MSESELERARQLRRQRPDEDALLARLPQMETEERRQRQETIRQRQEAEKFAAAQALAPEMRAQQERYTAAIRQVGEAIRQAAAAQSEYNRREMALANIWGRERLCSTDPDAERLWHEWRRAAGIPDLLAGLDASDPAVTGARTGVGVFLSGDTLPVG